ncbi:aldo/keto reductase [Kineosporia sp. J2-2]|uniref:Aldo/keto reductase n=1 Tax=Kineosporia corallincola TaxID=2835133 RepID=A0ABS5TP59_9ACTN|nr:aldo/keto reductase [Kineosporia corallincola]MBT0772897.1 aldo/keto reductase [Kineosporia corallincola]
MSNEAAPSSPATVLGSPRIVLGGAFGAEPEQLTRERLDAFHAGGGRFVETAVSYLGGRALAAVGAWLARSPGALDTVVKIGHGDRGVDLPLSPEVVGRELDRAREVLGVDTVGVAVLHNDDPARPVEEIADTVAALVSTGRAGAVGASNWPPGRLVALAGMMRERGHELLASYHRSLAVPDPARFNGSTLPGDGPLFDAVDAAGLALLSWSANAGGYFARPDEDTGVLSPFDAPLSRQRRQRCRELAAQLGTDPSSIALAWVLARPRTWASVGPGTPDRVRQALAAARLELTAAQAIWLSNG